MKKDILFQDIENRTIFNADNLDILRGINSNSIDLIYLDPPFNKNETFTNRNNKKISSIKNYFLELQTKYNKFTDENFNKIFKDNTTSFNDTWNQTDINNNYYYLIDSYNSDLTEYLKSIKKFSINGGVYYLIYMSIRLIEMKRILKDTGSIYLHCDNTMGQYLKILLDIIFDGNNFKNSIIWHYFMGGKPKRFYARKHDIIYFYVKKKQYKFNQLIKKRRLEKKPFLINPYTDKKSNEKGFIGKDENGYFSNVVMDDVWDIPGVFNMSSEYMGYPTQKPLKLLERIIKTSSNEGDIVLDPFCGCATTCVASERLNRKWIGIDINKQAFYMNYHRMSKMGILGNIEQGSFKGDLYLAKKIPVRNDISDEELKKIEINLNEKKKIKQTKKVKLSSKEKEIVKELLYENQAGMCNGCDVYMRSVELTIDHIKPQAKEGDDDLDNLQLLCHRCNIWKSAKDMKYLLDKLLQENIISAGTYTKQINLHVNKK